MSKHNDRFQTWQNVRFETFFVCYQTLPILFFSTFAARQLKANGYQVAIRKLNEKTTILTKDKHEVF